MSLCRARRMGERENELEEQGGITKVRTKPERVRGESTDENCKKSN